MEENGYKCIKYCMACFSENATQIYKIRNDDCKRIFQDNILRLCFICMSIARNTETFIESVQRNQTLLHNLMKSARMTILSIEPRPIKNLQYEAMETIEIGREVCEIEPFPILVYSHSHEDTCEESSVTNSNEDISLFEIECDTSIVKTELLDIKCENVESASDFMNSSVELNSYLRSDSESVGRYADKTKEIPFITANRDWRSIVECDTPRLLVKAEPLDITCENNETNEDTDDDENTDNWTLKSKSNEGKSIVDERDIIEENISREDLMKEMEQSANEHYYMNSAFKCETCVKGFMFRDLYENHLKSHCETQNKNRRPYSNAERQRRYRERRRAEKKKSSTNSPDRELEPGQAQSPLDGGISKRQPLSSAERQRRYRQMLREKQRIGRLRLHKLSIQLNWRENVI
ncbi:uncharacterized protein LOC119837651 isoform X2 [Zerene cesonia]|uniref:uncharacterized protein LOC119837651 isoform X2 n=1 Tax=Zerene cesonia TaxID=33412 RepID=UPI0018E4F642|nr:uncharacterized protein LOC119837651 isoform X2 [Zerene cesonia]